jgi:maleylpyruvate isomerase
MGTSTGLPLLDETLVATTRYLAALTRLDDESARQPSVLPGWTRAHVVAHLSRNADGFTGVLRRAAEGAPAWMYDTQEARDADIERTVAELDARRLVADAEESSRRLEEAWRAYDGPADAAYSRLPDQAETWPVDTVGPRRRAEVEIHHADLALGYRPADWPADFSTTVIGQRCLELDAAPEVGPMVLEATDTGDTWTVGSSDGPVVSGCAGDLGYWLVGRGGGAGLTCSTGELPVLGRWR